MDWSTPLVIQVVASVITDLVLLGCVFFLVRAARSMKLIRQDLNTTTAAVARMTYRGEFG